MLIDRYVSMSISPAFRLLALLMRLTLSMPPKSGRCELILLWSPILTYGKFSACLKSCSHGGQVRSPFLLDLLSMEVQVSYCASAARIHATLVQKKSMFIPTLIRFAFDKGTMKMDDVATIGVTFGSLSLSLSWNIHLQKRQGH
ncbi:uncharacterized protein [Spinacia oleracea]|uniref:Uncharacterized protein LOC110794067 isoform X1 n=1 Tax=Spinacia oleracea TaxID=3562 RepID=A0A9R0K218_SPIOL|nr:uncharacterized protein LOC110794067 isoform X2 [Spinacia oleracea]XP_021854700.1 uncharacterized protein LOC110794067 isoform X2 [Spinacia oleracea]